MSFSSKIVICTIIFVFVLNEISKEEINSAIL